MSEVRDDVIRKIAKTRSGLTYLGYKTRRELSKEIRDKSETDDLTGLLNRRGWNRRTSEYLQHAARTGEEYVFVSVDLDDLKKVNDSFGHQAGDSFLKGTAEVLQAVARSSDILARYGGDEFSVLLPDTSVKDAETFKQRVLNESGDIKLSIGIGSSYAEADKNMYAMKEEHKHV